MADAKIRLSVDGTAQVIVDLSSVEGKMLQLEKQVSSSGAKIKDVMTAAAGALASWAIVDKVKDMAMLNARYETLGVSMAVVGKNAGYTGQQMEDTALALQKTGISMIESRQQTMRLVQAHIDLSNATKLARIAQDAAVIGNMNSSEAFAHMIHGIQTGQTDVLRTIGLNISMEDSYKQMAATLGKNKDMLTQNEKTQAVLNSVMAAGGDIAGAYTAAMDTAGKQILSMTRYTEDIKVLQGEVFNEVLTIAVMGYTEHLKESNGQLNEMAKNQELKQWGQDIAYTFSFIADSIDGAKNVAMLFGSSLGAVAAKWSNWREYVHDKEEAEKNFTGKRLEEENAAILAAYDQRRKSIDDAYNETQDGVLNKQGRFVRSYEERLKALAAKESAINAEKVAKQQDYFEKVLQMQRIYANYSLEIQQNVQRQLAQSYFGDNHKYSDTAPAAPKASTELSKYQQLIKSIEEKIAVQRLDMNTQEKLTEGEKLAAKVRSDLNEGVIKLTKSETANILELTRKLTVYEKHNQLAKEVEKSYVANTKAIIESFNSQTVTYGKAKDALDDYVRSVEENNAQTDLEISLMGKSSVERATALEQYRIELDLQKRIRDVRKLNLLDVDKESLISGYTEEATKAKAAAINKAQVSEWSKTVDTMDKTFHDGFAAMLDRGEGVWGSYVKSLRNTFKSTLVDELYKMFAKPFVLQAIAGIGSMFGMTGAAQASGAMGGVGSVVSGLSGVTSGLSNLYSLFTGGAQSAFNSFALSNMGMNLGLSSSLSSASTIGVGQLSGLGSTGQLGLTGMGQVGSSIAAAAPWVAAALAAYSIGTAAFGHGERQITGQNVTANVNSSGVSGSKNVSHTKSGGWFSSDINGQWNFDLNTGKTVADGVTYNDVTGGAQKAGKAIKAGFDSLLSSTMDFSKSLGLSADAIKDKTYSLKFDFGSTDAEFMTNLANALAGVADTMAQDLLPSIATLKLDGESAADAFKRLGIEATLVNTRIKDLGLTFKTDGLDTTALITAKDRLVQFTGGAQAFSDKTAYFAANFLTEAERMQPTIDSVTKGMADLGYANITTVEQFKNLVRGLDTSTEANAKLFASLMDLMPGFKTVADYMDSLGNSSNAAAAALAQTNKSIQDQIDQLRVSMMTQEEQQRKLMEGQDESTQAKYRELFALQAQKQATEDAAAAMEAAAARIKSVADERYNLETEYYNLIGDTAELRKRELEKLSPENRAYKEKIYAEMDAQKAQQAAQQAAQEAASAAAQLKSAWQSLADSIVSEVSRLRGLTSTSSAAGIAAAESQFAISTAQARAGDQDAMKLLPALSQALDKLYESTATSQAELSRNRAALAYSLEQTAGTTKRYGVTLPSYDIGTDYVPVDQIAQIHQGERITPAAYNRSDATNADLVKQMQILNEKIDRLVSAAKSSAESNRSTAEVLDNLTGGGGPALVKVVSV
ncbi:hypothetical protein KDM87_06810 [Undibacterium sp. FT147W]|uniref:Bacteriophage tail tape measure N-terminal domain-containing protein n=1 Tax=Undibacterium rivi TaxID=2828729 RepID=A0ABS5H0R8_9BURK|nr:hypothetical protein [Undibacterium rivi]MBR7792306.1 hypothetical protein [Undibacterium rivi]